MFLKALFRQSLIPILSFLLPFSVFAVVYVDGNPLVPGPRDGTSWKRAYANINNVIATKKLETLEIWVADGTYMESIVLQDSVHIYGGFEGYGGEEETSRTQRDWKRNITIINGSTARGGSPAYHVVSGIFVTDFIIDGFTITGGAATGISSDNSGGGISFNGIYGDNTISNCAISGNSAVNGGGIYTVGSSFTLANCEIKNNSATGNGGGMNIIEGSLVIVTDCLISGNTATGSGGGGYQIQSKFEFSNCVIIQNTSASEGGGLLLGDQDSLVINCTISGNSSNRGGGIAIDYSANPTIQNTIFEGNSHYAIFEVVPLCNPTAIENCLFYNNPGGAYQIYESDSYSDGQITQMNNDLSYANENITGAPNFANKPVGDMHITYCSAAIDRGTTPTITLIADKDGSPRLVDFPGVGKDGPGMGYDIGAYETQNGLNMTVYPEEFDFGVQDVSGGPTPPQTFTMINIGSESLPFKSISLSDKDNFSFTSQPDTTDIAPCYSRTVSIVYDPTQIGVHNAILTIFCAQRSDFVIYEIPLTGMGTGAPSQRILVDKNAPGPVHDGSAWVFAFTTIQQGIDTAESLDITDVWVADGTYPESITQTTGVELFGGFEGYGGAEETQKDERDWIANETIIDASTANKGTPAKHVVMIRNTKNTLLDGFTITGGFALGSIVPDRSGGGIFCENIDSSNIIANCIIKENKAEGLFFTEGYSALGGGIYCATASPFITDCIITANEAQGGGGVIVTGDAYGGGIYCGDFSAPLITNSIISRNEARGGMPNVPGGDEKGGEGFGGGVCIKDSNPRIENCQIYDNRAQGGPSLVPTPTSKGGDAYGGGFYSDNSLCYLDFCAILCNVASGGSAMGFGGSSYGGGAYCKDQANIFQETIISGNISRAGSGTGPVPLQGNGSGGGVYCMASSSSFTNCIISGNTAMILGMGGGMCCENDMSEVINCTISGNLAPSGGGIACFNNSDPLIKNTIFEDNDDFGIMEADADSDPQVSFCLFQNNPDGDYYDIGSIPNARNGAEQINGLPEADHNVEGDPLFKMNAPDAITGKWTSLLYDSKTNTSILEDFNAAYPPGGLAGHLVNPSIGGNLQMLILDNAATTMTVVGNIVSYYEYLDDYLVIDYHLSSLLSAALDEATSTGAPSIDFDLFSRPMDFQDAGRDGSGEGYDIGAFEYQALEGPNLLVLPSELDFGTRNVYDGATPAKYLTLVNVGNQTLTFSGITLDDPVNFSFTSPPDTSNLAGLTSRTISLTFDPGEAGIHDSYLSITSSDMDDPLIQVPLAGIGIVSPQDKILVDRNAPGRYHDGATWFFAFNTIQEGIDATANLGLPEVWVADGVYSESITLKSGLGIYGGFEGYGGAEETERDLRDFEKNFSVVDASKADGGSPAKHAAIMDNITTVTLDGFTITGGHAIGTIEPDNTGGGIYCNQVKNSLIKNCIVTRNYAQGAVSYDQVAAYGGGIYCAFSSLSIEDCAITDNVTTGCDTPPHPSMKTETNIKVSEKGGNAYGGGIYLIYHLPISIINCNLERNRATGGKGFNRGGEAYGGGAYFSGPVSMRGCIIAENIAMGGSSGSDPDGIGGNAIGGGIYDRVSRWSPTPSLDVNLSLSGKVDTEYGISNQVEISTLPEYWDPPLMTNCIVYANKAMGADAPSQAGDALGGGMMGHNAEKIITDCKIVCNTALAGMSLYDSGSSPHDGIAYGGGVFHEYSNASFSNTIISGNSALKPRGIGSLKALGGGVFCGGPLKYDFANCIISGNEATDNGGGVFFEEDVATSPVLMINCVVSGNSSSQGGGLSLYFVNPKFIIKNTIFENNVNQAIYEILNVDLPVSNSLFYNNPNGDYYDQDSVPNIKYGANEINAMPDCSDNVDGDPLLIMNSPNARTGSWGSVVYNPSTDETILTDSLKTYIPGQLKGLMIKPDKNYRYQRYIISNDEHTITVPGDIRSFVQPGDTYVFVNYRLLSKNSGAVDWGAMNGAPETDLDRFPRPLDFPGIGFDGENQGYDIGAYEFHYLSRGFYLY